MAFLLYGLSIGPVDGLATRYYPDPMAATWFPRLYAPLFWLTMDTPVERPLMEWRQWWIDLLRGV
ncbi:hypothetical protein AYO49_05775 [Verrucomicrobiaceae bacterium SCGC AG-212-N21]|nr:hypothetical protein AYO49_05775 [Verrucomicrobiaceae bacterium SCGC AG-212-N21]